MNTCTVITTPGYNQIGKLLRRFDKLLMHRFQYLLITTQYILHRTATLHHVSADIADQPYIIVGIHEYLQIHHIAQTFVMQRHDTLNDDYLFRLHVYSFLQSVAQDIRISGLFDSLTRLQQSDMLREKFAVEGIRMIEVDSASLFFRHVRSIIVVRIQRHHSHTSWRECLSYFLDDGRLTGTRTASYTNNCHIYYFISFTK